MNETPEARAVNRWALYFGWLGGAIAWIVHFVVVYIAAEFGCLSGMGHQLYAGINLVAWIVFVATILALGVTLTAMWIAYRIDKKLRVGGFDESDTPLPRAHLARTGLITSGIFAFLTAVQAIPVFFFLREC